ncbi:MAG: S-methyl-5'-thioadenosine phosphorylase [Nitrospirota bacterium]
MSEAEIGVIGGSGLYDMDDLKYVTSVQMDTPFGAPSDEFVLGTLEGRRLAFLPRHGRGHRFTPSEINYRANIYAFKKLGVERIISVSAVGSMKEEIKPGEIVVPDQFYDQTKNRASTFFGGGVVAHVGFADPVCQELAGALYDAGVKAGAGMHKGGTYICMEGPQFSTRGESRIYRGWGVDVIGMTNVTEAKLAREAEICYATLALATDYDCWHETEEDVTIEAVIAILKKNVETAKKIIQIAVESLPVSRSCQCGESLKYAIMTPAELIPDETKRKLDAIIGKYVGLEV